MIKLYLTLNTVATRIKGFLNYFSLKMILLNLLQVVAIDLFKYLVSHITIIPRNDKFLYNMKN